MRGKSILLVEDNPDDAHLTIAAFQEAGVDAHIEVARDGFEALARLSARAGVELPSVVLLDLNLPKLTGHEILELIRADPRTRLLPVVILTSSIEPADVSRCYALGANSFLRKPVDFTQFLETARLLSCYWLQSNVTAPP